MKKILYVVLGLLAIYLILCLIGPSEMKVERSIDINASPDLIKSKIIDLKFFHETWSPWTEKDPNMKVTYTGEMGKEGSSMSWKSDVKDVGIGSMTYKYTHGDTIMESLVFEGQGEGQIYHVVTPNGNTSKVTWHMFNKVPFVIRPMILFMNVDKMVGPDFEKGLSKLKTAMESMSGTQPTANYEIKEMNWDAKTFYGKKETLTFDKMSAFFGKTYGAIGVELGKEKVQPIGQPKAIYFSFDEKTMISDVAAVMEVANGTKLAHLEKFETPESKVLLIEYYGAYDKSADAHHAMDNYIKDKGLTQSYVIEEYVTDPMSEKDTAKWLTNIFYMVK
jgi:effector-binding domain-containing protein